MKCADGSCQFRSVRGLITSLLRLAKKWHSEEVAAGRLTNDDWESHYGKFIAERLTPYLTSLQSHEHSESAQPAATTPVVTPGGYPSVFNAIPFETPEERGDSQPYPKDWLERPISSRLHVG